MRKFFPLNVICSIVICFIACSSCSKSDNKSEITKDKIANIIAKSDSMLPNYRFVNVDTVFVYYHLAKDYTEEWLKQQENLENEAKRYQNNLQSKAANIEKKRQNNIYMSEASYNSDLQELAQLQESAQKNMLNLQNTYQTAQIRQNQIVIDSINSFINDYNRVKGYDAIFLKEAAIYYNPALDITYEVIEGLNARYNKVK